MNSVATQKLSDNCVEYLQNNVPSGNGEDLAHLSPFDTNLKVTLADHDLWIKFLSENNEMIVTKPGRWVIMNA